MKFHCVALFAMGVLSPFVLHAETSSESAYNELHQISPNAMQANDAVEVQAKVLNINKSTREITFETESGERVSVKASPEIRNFSQIKKGDVLKVNYMESLVLELKRNEKVENGIVRSTDIVRARPGQKPSGQVVSHYSAVGTITRVDGKSQNVTVKGPQRTITFHVKDKSILDELKKGDQIEARYTEAMALSFESVKR
ncbi:hypothetical protein [Bdellovibrio sp. HCB209]|uniref:hypothetical protein n=1 Tax=Bdellovibrio sp. HCB209 TaxID=3394354 RepID=UPI0039B39539